MYEVYGNPGKLYQGSAHFKTKKKSNNDLMEVDSFFETLASKGSQVQQVVPVGQGVLQPLLYPLRSKVLLLHQLVSHRHDAHQLRLVTADLVLQSLPQTQQLSKSNLRTTTRARLIKGFYSLDVNSWRGLKQHQIAQLIKYSTKINNCPRFSLKQQGTFISGYILPQMCGASSKVGEWMRSLLEQTELC